MSAPLLLLASLVGLSDERIRPPAGPEEHCVELRQFRANGGCRVAVDRTLAWMCVAETKRDQGSTRYYVSFKSDEGAVVKRFAYDRKQEESWSDHSEIFYMAADSKLNPDLKIGIANDKDSQVVVGKSRYCLPAEGAKAIKR